MANRTLKSGSDELLSVFNALAANVDKLGAQGTYDPSAVETLTTGALASNPLKKFHKLAVDGTLAFTHGAPTVKNQEAVFWTSTAVNTPVATLTVTGMDPSADDVFAGFGTISASAPKSLHLMSPDGLKWVIVSMVGVTVS